jgi:uncharacterized membrane protein
MIGAVAAIYSLVVRPVRRFYNGGMTQYPQYSQYSPMRGGFGMFGLLNYVIDFTLIATAIILAYMAITKPKTHNDKTHGKTSD